METLSRTMNTEARKREGLVWSVISIHDVTEMTQREQNVALSFRSYWSLYPVVHNRNVTLDVRLYNT